MTGRRCGGVQTDESFEKIGRVHLSLPDKKKDRRQIPLSAAFAAFDLCFAQRFFDDRQHSDFVGAVNR